MNPEIYRTVKREYDIKKIKIQNESESKREELYKALPKYQELELKKNNLAIEYARNIINSVGIEKQIAEENLELKLNEIEGQIDKVLINNGYNKSFTMPKYECEICKDTGIICEGGKIKHCSCFTQKIVDLTYRQNNMLNLEEENFNTFDIAYYSNVVDKEKYGSEKSPLENVENIKSIAVKFCENLKSPKQKNLLFVGNTGTGKTFISNCIAKEAISKGCTVLYQTSSILMDMIIESKFASQKDSWLKEQYEKVFEVDLLIIDDLGTETLNNVKFTELFNIINTRLLKHKKTIISTNLMLPELAAEYDERVISRLIGNYIVCKFFGDDIRLKKKKLSD